MEAGGDAPRRRGVSDSLAWLTALTALGGIGLASLAAIGVFATLFAVVGAGAGQAEAPVCAVSPEAGGEIPQAYLRLYKATGATSGLDWSVLAAIGSIESGHGRNVGPSSAGALGPMQFMPGTWQAYGVDGDGDGRRDVMDPEDAIPAAARLLRANGAPARWERALFAYNHAGWYVRQVLGQAERYRGACRPLGWAGGSGQMAWPLRGPVTSPFCERRSWERCHPGIDIGVPAGSPVHAAEAGRVALAGPVSGYGYFICVDHEERLASCYAHLSSFLVTAGDRVRRGDVLALSGCSGRCFGPHLHFEVRLGGAGGTPVDPGRYLEAER